jgi:hypothetical protein
MAFTAGSAEQAKAIKLASILSERYQKFSATASAGYTGAVKIEKLAKKLGFGITGLTTGAGFPPFGSAGHPTNASNTVGRLSAALQNPRGETAANGINLGLFANGATVGIYLRKFVRGGEDYSAIMFSGLTLASATTVAGTTFQINGAFTAHTNDLVVIGGNSYKISGGITSAAAGSRSEVTVSTPIGQVFSTGTALNLQTVGVTRGTSGIAGATFERFGGGNAVNGGFTACVFFGGAEGSTGTVS